MSDQTDTNQTTTEVTPTITNDHNANTIDEMPVGGGNTFNVSEFPDSSAPPPQKKAVKKATKAVKKQIKGGQNGLGEEKKKEEGQLGGSQPLDEIPVGSNNASTFDDKPIPKSNFDWSQFPEGEQAQPQQTNYTMMQLLKSKANKMKLQGLQRLLEMLQNDPKNEELMQISMPPYLKETVPANLQKSLQCMQAWIKGERNWGEDQARNTIEYGYINGKANTKKLAVQIIDQMYQLQGQMMEILILTGFKSKPAKNIAGYLGVVNELLTIYGIKRMKYLKPYLNEIVRIVSTQKLPAVKNQGMNVLKSAYKWMTKDVVEPMIKDIKENLKKELDTFWDGYDKDTVMTAPKDIPEEEGKGKGKKVDAYELSEAVDIFKKYNDKWADSVINAAKWNEKTAKMQEFVKDASVPKLANTDFRPATQVIRRLINDSNFNVVLWVLRMVGAMAKGLRRPFAGAAKSNFFNIIGKFRDKKTLMIEETFKTLNDLNYCLNIEQVLEDVKQGLGDKAPNMRINLLNWIGKYVEQKVDEKGECPQKTRQSLKQMFGLFEKLTADGVSEVRETMARNMGKMEVTMQDEDFFAPIKGKLSKTLVSKMEQKDPPKRHSEQTNKSQVGNKTPRPQAKPVQRGTPKKEKQPEKKQPEKPKVKEEVIPPPICYDEPNFDQSLQTLIGLGFPEEEVKRVTSASAAQRSKIIPFLRENPYSNFNEILRVLQRVYKEWKQVNLNMNKDLIAYIEERQEDITEKEAYVIMPYIVEKIADNKFAEQLNNILAFMAKQLPPKFLVGHILRYIRSTEGKKPKLNGDTCVLLAKIVEMVGINNLYLKELAQFAKDTYAVQFSKKGATELLSCLYLHSGDSVKKYLDEATEKGMAPEFAQIKPNIAAGGKTKVEAVEDVKPASKKVEPKSVAASTSKGSDFASEIHRLLPKMNDKTNWQKRKQAAESLAEMLEDGKKVSLGNCTDLLTTLKARINDPNKQLIKVFVHLTGLVIPILPDRELKQWSHPFITTLAQGLNDKSEVNRREIRKTLNKIGEAVGKEDLLFTLGPFLSGDKEGRIEIIAIILQNQEGIPKADIREYSKGITTCLTDKNKQVRDAGERLFQRVLEKLGIEVFRKIAKDQRPATSKDLNNFLDKYDKNGMSNSSFHSRGASPSRNSEKEVKQAGQTKSRVRVPVPPPTSSAKKRSIERNYTAKSLVSAEEDPHAATVTGNFFMPKSAVEGNQMFANLKLLAKERTERQNDDSYQWRLDEMRQGQQDQVKQSIERLIRTDLAKKMMSHDYKRAMQAVVNLNKITTNVSYQSQIRQLYDVLMKWLLLRLWGGQTGLVNSIELVVPVLSVLEKKKLALTDFEVDLILTILRQYFLSAFMLGNKLSESVQSIIKCLVALHSGDKVLRKLLKQFYFEPTSIHKHMRKDSGLFYREALSRLVKIQLIDYVGNEDTLEEASKIRQLKEDAQFVEMLFKRFHENVLSCFGFKRSHQNYNNQSIASVNNASFVSDRQGQKDKSVDRLPPRGHQSTNTMMELRQGQGRKTIPAQQAKTPNQPRVSDLGREPVSNIAPNKHQPVSHLPLPFQTPYQKPIDMSLYPAPNPSAPMSRQLGKLLPPQDTTISFFNSLFQEKSQKIVGELTTYAKCIFGSILKSVQEVMVNRNNYSPQLLVSQILLLQNCIKCIHVMKNVGDLLGFGVSFALNQLVYQDQNKAAINEELKSRNIEFKTQNFIKAVNGAMLRLLENGNTQDIVNVLLQLLSVQFRKDPSSTKSISLVVKCLGRVSTNFCKDFRTQGAKRFIIEAVTFLGIVQYDTPLETLDIAEKERNRERIRPEDSAANSIKTIMIELCQRMSSDIWEVYEKAALEFRLPDRCISEYIASLNVRVPEKPRARSQFKENEELRKINELLSKSRTYDSGIIQLKKYLDKNPNFNAYEYFNSLNYDQKFVTMVMRAIDNPKSVTPNKNQDQHQENIQDKIQKLKRRFQDLQPEQSQPAPSASASKGGAEEGGDRAAEIKRRIEEMKTKMSSTVGRK